MSNLLSKLKHFLIKSIPSHIDSLFNHLDPVITEKKSKTQFKSNFSNSIKTSRQWDLTFLFPLITIIGTTLYGTVFITYLKAGYFDMTILANSPQMAYHQAFPKAMWRQIDTCYTLAIPTIVATFASFLLPENPVSSGVQYHQNGLNTLSINGKSMTKIS